MALAASGAMSLILSRAKKTLGQCTTWQTWTGDTGDETAATLHVAEYEKEWSEAEVAVGRDVRAMVSIEMARPWGATTVWTARVLYHFEAPVSGAYAADPEQAFREFNNNLAAVMAEIQTDCAADVSNLLLAIRPGGIQLSESPKRVPEDYRDTDGDVIWAEVAIDIGPGG